MKALVLGVFPYRMEDESTKKVIEGASVHMVDMASIDRNCGYRPMKVNISLDDFTQFNTLPGYYEVKFDTVPGAGGKVKAVFDGATFIKEAELKLPVAK